VAGSWKLVGVRRVDNPAGDAEIEASPRHRSKVALPAFLARLEPVRPELAPTREADRRRIVGRIAVAMAFVVHRRRKCGSPPVGVDSCRRQPLRDAPLRFTAACESTRPAAREGLVVDHFRPHQPGDDLLDDRVGTFGDLTTGKTRAGDPAQQDPA